MYVNEIIEFTNARGASVVIGNASYGLVSVEGLGDVAADIQQQSAPFQDGTTFVDALLEPRYIPVEFIVRGDNYNEIRGNRVAISNVLNPKLGPGLLRYKSGEDVREIYAITESVPVFADKDSRIKRAQRGMVTFVAPNPYWRSPSITEEPAFEGLFQFPFEGEFQMGIQRDERIIINDGDAPAPLNVIFYGPAQTPTIANLTTGEFIKINRELGENEKLIVDTSDENKSLYFEDENGVQTNVFHWIDLDSTFFKLQVGENEISCMCATSNLSKDFEIYYHKLYTAV